MNKEAEKLIEDFCEVIKNNEKFLREYAEETYNECIELINDAIDYAFKNKENYTNSFYFFSNHILMPQSYAVWMDLLYGNLPACFMELRLILESLAGFSLIDSFSQESDFFEKMLNAFYKGKPSDKLKEFGNKIGVKNEPFNLWKKLSQNWVHPKGIIKRLISEITKKSDVPSWAWIIPMEYTNSDLKDIEELGECISKLRELIKAVIR